MTRPYNRTKNPDPDQYELEYAERPGTWIRFDDHTADYLEGSEAEQAEEEQTAALEHDEREGLIRLYLEMLLPAEWNTMSIGERRNFVMGSGDIGRVGIMPRKSVSNIEIWCECLGQEPSKLRKQDSYEITGIMRRMEGWKREGMKRLPLYGVQRVYVSVTK